ncbi:LLM class flavin-dependent oxidoreductase [Nakamurella leprariae]|uniref:LLM class flavin-dependent oxidoreductase n=1 Tax=Nakamurella leprariae TaxID=2803911 RepID=A0A939BX70_9ACTN|nr:LLM class flavin-dependent oxidoreductase [Nakamurella leprariae]MBM9465670.1 LLM class flavin-dependent oxidoreductase [Nakamurella leprariae]
MSLAVGLDLRGFGSDSADLIHTVTAVEAAGFSFVTFTDSPLPADDGTPLVEAGTRAAFVALHTDRLGLVPQLQVTTTEPFHLSTQLSTLDHLSAGRAGWWVGAVNDPAALATIGTTPRTQAELHTELSEVVQVARLLWDSWEDDAAIRDTASGRYLDADRVHHVNFVGSTFSVVGPLITQRSPQGQIVVLVEERHRLDAQADLVLLDDLDSTTFADRSRQVRQHAALPLARIDLAEVPGADELVSLIREITAGGASGVLLRPRSLPHDLPVLADRVLPALIDLALFRPPAAGATLRSTLGLGRPVNHFSTR